MPDYDPENPPDPEEWLAAGHEERTRRVRSYLERDGSYGGSLERQSQVHAAIETQLATKIAPVKAAFMRLRDNGLSRHEAIRALGSVLGRHIDAVMASESPGTEPDRGYLADLESLTADTFYEGKTP